MAAFGRIYKIVAEGDLSRKRAKRCLPFTCSMFVKYFEHKGPRLEARPWLMAAFYNFKAAVSAFHSDAKRRARGPACLKFSDGGP